MWAYRMCAPGQLERVEVAALTPDSLSDGHLLLRPLHGGICGSDGPGFKGLCSDVIPDRGLRAAEHPGFPLHEVVGEVVADPTGTHVPGTRVVGWASGFDALAELVSTKASSVVAIPEDLPIADAVVLQPLACVLYTLGRMRQQLNGARVAVIGLGPIGLLFGHAASAFGATYVEGIDVVDRTDDARPFGLDAVIHASSDRWARTVAEDQRPDVVIEAAGHQVGTLTDAVNVVRPGGTIFYFGVPDDDVYPFPMYTFLRKGAVLYSGVVTDHTAALNEAIGYARTYPEVLASNISHRFDINDVNEAFRLATARVSGRRKVVIDYPGDL